MAYEKMLFDTFKFRFTTYDASRDTSDERRIMQNKANFRSDETSITLVITEDYENE